MNSSQAAVTVSSAPVQTELPSVPFKMVFDKGLILLHSVISEGDYGCVYRGIFQIKGSTGECAAKCCLKPSLSLHRLMFFRREAVLHARVASGECIASLYDIYEDESFIWIIMEYYPEGDLWKAIVNDRFKGRNELIRKVFSRIIRAVEYCHSRSVYHRDLKPENILLDETWTKPVLADFGLASGTRISGEMRCGSSYYMSPECWGGIFDLDLPYENAPHDVWSLGVVLFNLICRRHAPWKQATNKDPVFRQFLASPRSVLLQYPISFRICNLLERVFKIEPKQRITLSEFRKEINRIKFFSRHESFCRRMPSPFVSRAISAIVSYPFRVKSINASQPLPATWETVEEYDDDDDESSYSAKSYVPTGLNYCVSSSESQTESVMLPEGPTVRLIGNDDPLCSARRVPEEGGLD